MALGLRSISVINLQTLIREMSTDRAYRAYVIGNDGLILRRIDLHCVDDANAMQQAKALLDVHDVELWNSPMKLETFKTLEPKE